MAKSTVSNSFHASAKAHAIRNTSKLAAVQLHDSRGYLSFSYDHEKIKSLIGDANSIVDDVKTFINDNFAKVVDDYNHKQKRNDRKIKTTPFDHFESNKKLDLAVESIFQVGDKDFWSQYRTDKFFGKSKKEKDIIIHSYDEEIIDIMNDIYKKQAKALETIYIDKKDDIINKLEKSFNKADKYLNEFEAKYSKDKKDQFDKIFKLKPKDRQPKIALLSLEDKKLYSEYAANKTDWVTIKESRLIERTRDDQMHINIINLTAHYDEYSPHAHGVFVMSADGYKTSLSSRVAKSVVLNKWSLEVIQERMHEIAKEEMNKHPEVFNKELRNIREGRNYDYSKEQYIDNQIKSKIKENEELKSENEKLKNEKNNLIKENTELRIANNTLEEENKRIVNEVNETIDDNNRYKEKNEKLKIENENLKNETIKLKNEKEELENNLNEIDNKLIEIKNDIDEIKEDVNKIEELNETKAGSWLTEFFNKIKLGIKIYREKNNKDPSSLSIPVTELIKLENILKPFVKLREKVNALHNKLDEVIKSASKISLSRDVKNKNIDEKEIEEPER